MRVQQHPRIQYGNQNSNNNQRQLDHVNQNVMHLHARIAEADKKLDDFKTTVKQCVFVGILGLGVAILAYQNAGSIQPKLQSLGKISMADLQTAAGNGWKETTLLFHKTTNYLSSLLP
jgi:hypothetical protein